MSRYAVHAVTSQQIQQINATYEATSNSSRSILYCGYKQQLVYSVCETITVVSVGHIFTAY